MENSHLSINSQTRGEYESVLSTAAAPLIVPDGAAEIDHVISILQGIRSPVEQNPLLEQGAPPPNYYDTTYGICFIRGGELVWANYLPGRGVRPSSSETASAEEESQFKVAVDALQSLVQRSQAA